MTGEQVYDLAVIGAGINGAGIARDAALRGLDVIIIDKNDMCSGCSAISSRLIHGGLRYLEYGEIGLVYESLHERRYLRLTAPHLVKPLRICIPIYQDARRSKLLIRLGMIAYDILSWTKSIPSHRMLTADEMRAAEPGLASAGLRGAARYYDAQVAYAERLVLENLIAAKSAGAEIRLHCEVTRIVVEDGAVAALDYRDLAGGEARVAVKAVVNAAGPWVDSVLDVAPTATKRLIGGTKGSHIVVGKFAGAPADAFYVEAASDGRPFFIIPWNDQYLIGTTDIRFSGDPGDVYASEEEIDYLLTETNAAFPSANLTRADIHFSYAGVRPLPRQDKGPESAITRKHIILRHKKQADGLFSIIGGKLTTYRHLAEQAVNKAVRQLGGGRRRCRTRDEGLPGSIDLEAARKRILAFPGLPTACAARLIAVYGSRGEAVAALSAEYPGFADEEQTVLVAEVIHAIRHEHAKTLTDIMHRRLMTGLRPDLGRAMSSSIADIAASENGWNRDERQAQLGMLREHESRLRGFAE